MKKRLITLLLVLFSISSYAQNYLFEDGESGAHIFGQIGSFQGTTVLGIAPGYTWNGRTSFSVTAGRERNDDWDITVFDLKPYLSHMILKQNEDDMPISFALGAAYQYSFSPDDKDTKVHTYAFDGSIYHRLYLSENVSIIPSGMVGWGKTFVKETGYDSESSSAVTYGVQASALFRNFHITPNVQFSRGNTIFNVLIGAIFPL